MLVQIEIPDQNGNIFISQPGRSRMLVPGTDVAPTPSTMNIASGMISECKCGITSQPIEPQFAAEAKMQADTAAEAANMAANQGEVVCSVVVVVVVFCVCLDI
jgi:hypothetical protein